MTTDVDQTEEVRRQLLDSVAGAQLALAPWQWAYIPATFDRDTAHGLASEFPTSALVAASSLSSTKQYSLSASPIGGAEPMSPRWATLVGVLQSTEYRSALGRLVGFSLALCELDLSVWEYAVDDWLGPHVDKPEKAVTHVFYVPTEWDPSWGGDLEILESATGMPIALLPPTPGASSIIVRSSDSWHQVGRVRPSATVPRRSVTATFRWPSIRSSGDALGPGVELAEALRTPSDLGW